MKILNLFAGIGGNRKLWGDKHEITAVENNHNTAEVYRHFYPADTVIEADAHQFLLEHYKEFDFIWSSPPCPSHSKFNNLLYERGIIRYPDMSLYQEIIFLKHFAKGKKWIVENVEPYYLPLIQATALIERHLVWSNFRITPLKIKGPEKGLRGLQYKDLEREFGIELPEWATGKRLMLRDITRPEIGEHILKAAQREVKQGVLL